MLTITREMKTEEKKSNANFKPCCQASYNSDGNITLRNYDRYNKDKDEIIILSDSETQAIIRLFRKLKENDILPF